VQEHRLPWAVSLAERARKTLLSGEWAYQHENAWGATGLKLVPAEWVTRAVQSWRQPQSAAQFQALLPPLVGDGMVAVREGGAVVTLGVGLDRAGVSRRGDRSVWSVVARIAPREGEPTFKVLRSVALPTGSEAEVLQEWRRTLEVFGGPTEVLFESYGCEDLVEKVPGARLASPSSQHQQGLFNRLRRLFEESRIQLPADTSLLKEELVAFEYDAEREGLTRFGTQRGHDDTCYSLAWACEAADGGLPVAAPGWMQDVANGAEWPSVDLDGTDDEETPGERRALFGNRRALIFYGETGDWD